MNLVYSAVAIATTVTAAVSTFVWYSKPSLVLRFLMRISWYKIGARIKYINQKNEQFCYAERGTPRNDRSTLVFIHGFSGSKDNWITLLQRLDKDLHVICVDLPGHGNSSIPNEVSVFFLAQKLHEMLELANLNKYPIHLIGLSMGGTVASIYASKYQKDVCLLTLICPAMLSPNKSKLTEELRAGRNRLLAETVEELDSLLSMMLYHKERKQSNRMITDPPPITFHNHCILKGFLQLRSPNMDFYKKLMHALHSSSEDLAKCLDKIESPTQIIWGSDDELIDVSGARYLQQHLPNCRRVEVLSECGHAVSWDQPDLATEYIVEFRSSIDKKSD